MIDYSPLWKTMQEKQISQYTILKSGIDNETLDSLKKNKLLEFIKTFDMELYFGKANVSCKVSCRNTFRKKFHIKRKNGRI